MTPAPQSAPMTATALDPLEMLMDAARFAELSHPEWSKAAKAAVAHARAAASPRLAGREEIARIIDPHAFAQPRGIFYIAPNPDDARAAQREALRAADAILSLLGRAPVEWRDIASAPKDGTAIQGAWFVESMDRWMQATLVWTSGGGWFETFSAHHRLAHCVPTHWKPLDAPPSSHPSQVLGSDDNA